MQTTGSRLVNGRAAAVAALWIFFAATGSVRAGLEWGRTTVTMDPHGSRDVQTASFDFRNTSDVPVRIRGTKTSCGCTVVKPDHDVIAPGESGVLRVEHKPKLTPGLHRYRITVTTDEDGGRTQDLWLVVTGEQRLLVEGRRMVVWEKNEAPAAKEIIFRAKPGFPLRTVAASADSDIVSVELGRRDDAHVLRITPKGGMAGRARIRLQTTPPLPEVEDTFYAVVR